MIKTLTIAFAGMFLLASTTAFAEDAFKAENVPPVVQQLGQPSGLFPQVDGFFRRGPMTTWAARGPANPWDNSSDK